MADTHPSTDTKTQRRRTVFRHHGPDIGRPGPQILYLLLQDRREGSPCVRTGVFEEVIEDFGQVIKRINDRFGTTFSLFHHDEENVSKVFAGIETRARKLHGETLGERKVARPSAVRERLRYEIQYDLDNPKRNRLIAEAEAVYNRLTNPMRKPTPGKYQTSA